MLTSPATATRLLSPPDGYPAAKPRSLIARTADYLMLFGLALTPVSGLALGGRFGTPYADIVLFFAATARGFHVLTEGVSVRALRRNSYLLALLGVFMASGLIGTFANNSSPIAWPYLRLLIATVGAVLLVLTFGDDLRARWRLLQAYGLGTILLSLSSFYGPQVQGRRLGYTIHPNALGHSCMMGFATAVWLWDNSTRRNQRFLWGGAALLNLFGIMQSGSRGAVVGLAVAIPVYLAFRGKGRLNLAVLGATWLATMVVVLGIVNLPASNPVRRLVSEGTENTGSNASRRELLEDNYREINEDPMWGAGFDDDLKIISVHVVYFQAWIGAGAIGALAIMLTGVTMLVLPLLGRRRDMALCCGAQAIAIAWLFTNILSARDQWIWLAIVFGTIPSFIRDRPGDPRVPAGHDGSMRPWTAP